MGLSTLFKALSDSTRREILRLLTEKDLTAGEIADSFHLTKPTISHHLNVLKEAGLILDERRGLYIIYSLNTTVFQEVVGWVFDFTRTMYNKERENSEKGG